MSKSTKVSARVRSAGTTELEDTDSEQSKEKKVQKMIAKHEARKGSTLPDQIAGDEFYVKNYPIPKGKEMFPAEWRLQYVDLFYPYAPGGPLFIDTPLTDFDVKLCERKLEAMKAAGLRYTFIKNGEGLADVMVRLESVEREGARA